MYVSNYIHASHKPKGNFPSQTKMTLRMTVIIIIIKITFLMLTHHRSEGAYLEPDERYDLGRLLAIKSVFGPVDTTHALIDWVAASYWLTVNQLIKYAI